VSDIEIIEDYPSHYSAHNKRKHRWLRGDWQIAGWLLPMVPEESGHRVPNPLSVISRWKIFDNLRRSLVEPAIFVMFLLGWLCLPGTAAAWTTATVVILFLPALCQVAVELSHAATAGRGSMGRDALDGFFNASVANVLTIAFLAHQALLAMDAVVRTLVRRLITRQKLLQWETAAQAELAGDKRTTLDIYLNWTPALALVVFALVSLLRPRSLLAALPVLLLWACSQPVSTWLDRPRRAPRRALSAGDRELLRGAALRTWRYFAEFSTAQHHWLIPDNVREEDMKVAARVSTTNLGLLLNARQAACALGYLTIPEFARLTLLTLDTVRHLTRHRGHLLNWYDTESLQALNPAVISSVDNGNLLASLWTLQQGSLALLRQPLFPSELAVGLEDHLSQLLALEALPRRNALAIEQSLQRTDWLEYVLDASSPLAEELQSSAQVSQPEDARWFREQAQRRIRQLAANAHTYAPWLLPQFAALRREQGIQPGGDGDRTLQQLPEFVDRLTANLKIQISSGPEDAIRSSRELLALLPEARARIRSLIDDLNEIAGQSATLAQEMDFGFLINPGRKLLTVAFELDKGENHPACYDLLASEARIAYFVAIAKDDIPQESWFLLGRPPLQVQGITGLLSWTGTMFEYLMPALWMRVYPNTLLECAAEAAVRTQQSYAAGKRVPWGISESASSKLDDSGNYRYFAFGVPALAISKHAQEGPVISPYSSFLALNVQPAATLRNLRSMQRRNWLGAYGFYEALDFSQNRRASNSRSNSRSKSRGPEAVRCWMAHHQSMSLLAIANFLHGNVVQNWFHSHPRVQATELLLQEKPLARVS
jgi:VanZ family protein